MHDPIRSFGVTVLVLVPWERGIVCNHQFLAGALQLPCPVSVTISDRLGLPSDEVYQKGTYARRALIKTSFGSQVVGESVADGHARGFPMKSPRAFTIRNKPMVHRTESTKAGRIGIWANYVKPLVPLLPLLFTQSLRKNAHLAIGVLRNVSQEMGK